MFNRIIAFLLVGISAFMSIFGVNVNKGTYKFTIDTSDQGRIIENPVSNVNVWEMGQTFVNAKPNNENNIFDFVEYVQLMQCTGGTYERDLFKDPYDRTVLDDYKFDKLINNCKGILALGAKPCIKFGNVPMKYSANARANGMECNVLPPDDYDVYYNYIKAICQALVDEFGREEVLTWHYTAFTEYENTDWFECETPEKSAEETCKMYDYIVDALQTTIGENVYIGAHSMTVTEGGWDEAVFIKHCAEGTNYKTGKKGTRICCLSASYYESEPGNVGKRKTLAETINYLRDTAEKYGLKDLDYGIDEGRILCGTISGKDTDQLFSRTVGYIWQAGFDANIYGQMLDNNINYFSHWDYFSNGLMYGNPTLSYHVSSQINKFTGSNLLNVKTDKSGYIYDAVVKTYSAFDNENNVLHIMSYNYKNDLEYSESAKVNISVSAPQFEGKKVKITTYRIDDNCNYFDEWLEDREKYGIEDSDIAWSPQCPCFYGMLNDSNDRKIYDENLKSKYAECSRLVPQTTEADVVDGKISIDTTIGANNVVFYEIAAIN